MQRKFLGQLATILVMSVLLIPGLIVAVYVHLRDLRR
jgi:uncharacterized membrane protein YqaE (UPF0057 family)